MKKSRILLLLMFRFPLSSLGRFVFIIYFYFLYCLFGKVVRRLWYSTRLHLAHILFYGSFLTLRLLLLSVIVVGSDVLIMYVAQLIAQLFKDIRITSLCDIDFGIRQVICNFGR